MYYGTEMNALNFWGQKLTVQGYGGIIYAATVTTQVETYNTQRLVSS